MLLMYLLWGWEVCCVMLYNYLNQLSIIGQIKCSVFQSILILFQLQALCVRTFDTRVVANNLWSHPGQGPGSARVRVPGMVSYSHPNILCCWNVHISAFALYVVSPPPDLFIWTQAILIFSALMRWVSSPGHGLSIFVSAHFSRVTETDRSNINSAQVKFPILKV